MDIQNVTPKGASVVQLTPVKNQSEEKVAAKEVEKKDRAAFENKIAERLDQIDKDVSKNEISEKSVKKAVGEVNDFFQNEQRQISFSMNDTTGSTIIQVKDSTTDEVIRQIPAEHLVKLAERIGDIREQDDSAAGMLLKELA